MICLELVLLVSLFLDAFIKPNLLQPLFPFSFHEVFKFLQFSLLSDIFFDFLHQLGVVSFFLDLAEERLDVLEVLQSLLDYACSARFGWGSGSGGSNIIFTTVEMESAELRGAECRVYFVGCAAEAVEALLEIQQVNVLVFLS